MMKNLLITGGLGFIGSHTSLLLLERGYHLFVIDSMINTKENALDRIRNFQIYPKENINNLHFFRGDLRDKELLNKVFLEAAKLNKSINSVIHFAGLKSVEKSNINPIQYWDNNVLGTINLLKSMEENDCFKIVFSSSATIYENTGNLPKDENTTIKPINPYGNTKACVEFFLNDVYNSDPKKWKIANLRYFNPIGAHPTGLLGENPLDFPTNIFPIILKVASREIKEISIFGQNWDTPDGTCIRDYIHIMDLAEAHIKALVFLDKNKPQNLKLNIGTGRGCSVLELIDTFERINKIKLPYKFCPPRKGDLPIVVADNSKAIEKIKWKPSKTIEDMCKDGWRWQKNLDKVFF